jgi:hypothetical protein
MPLNGTSVRLLPQLTTGATNAFATVPGFPHQRFVTTGKFFPWADGAPIFKAKVILEIFSFFEDNDERHTLRDVLSYIDIPYFESYNDKDSVDFLMNLEISPYKLFIKIPIIYVISNKSLQIYAIQFLKSNTETATILQPFYKALQAKKTSFLTSNF